MSQAILRLLPISIGSANKWTTRRLPHSPNVSDKMHWATRAAWKRAWEGEVWAACLLNRKSLTEAKENAKRKLPLVHIILHAVQPMDLDNSYRSVKPLLDGLVKVGVVKNDRQKDVKLSVETVKVEHKIDEHVEIVLKF